MQVSNYWLLSSHKIISDSIAETTFSNEYFRLLLEERWSPKTTQKGKPWTGPDQFEDSTGNLMMLQSDMALIADPALKKWVEIYAKDEDRFFKVRIHEF